MVAQRIQGDYDRLQEILKVFMHHADMTVALTVQVEGLVEQLQGGAWRGVGAEAFYAEMGDLILPAMRRLEDALQFAGEKTGKIHHILREAEEEAARLFRGEASFINLKLTPSLVTHPFQMGPQGSTPTPLPPLPLISFGTIPEDYKYRTASGQEVPMPDGQQQALATLRKLLDPSQFRGPNGELAWWHEDGKVTIDEILALIVFHEGKDVEAVRQAIYMRYLFYMGGTGELGFSLTDEDNNPANGFQNTHLDRLLRFLAYYEPWRDPDSTVDRSRIPFNIDFTPEEVVYPSNANAPATPQPTPTLPATTHAIAQGIFAEVEAFLRDNQTQIPTGINQIADWQAGDANPMSVFGNVPFHFANRNVNQWNLPIQNAINARNFGTGANQIYFGGQGGLIVLTPNQAVQLGGSTDGGVTLP
ncbi:MAG: WXG100 family type VII secretion target [Anaerolineae bacterium]|nr:WXG100 family type VII secretion target [Anaerolineae bacterium]